MDIPEIELQMDVSKEKPGLMDQMRSNPFFTAGFGLGALGAATGALKKLSVIGISILRRK